MDDRISSIIIDMDTIGSRLRAERKRAGLTQEQLGEQASVSKQAISQIESGATKSPEASTLEPICRRLKISQHWLLTGKGPRLLADGVEEDWADILGYSQALGLGNGEEAQEYAESHKLKFKASSLQRKRLRPDKLAVMYGKGDSMLPRIRSGDAVLFDTSDTRPQDEALFVIQCPGLAGNELSVKRCRYFADDVFFDSLNPEGDHNWRKPRKQNDSRAPIEILGRVRWIGSWED